MPGRGQNEAAQLSALIGDAYDASLDPELWPSVLEKVGAFARGSFVNLFSQDVVNHRASRLFTWGSDPYHHALYLEKYAALNPLFPKGLSFPVGEVMQQTDIISHAAYRRTRFYKEWAKPQGFIDFAGVTIEKVATSIAALAVVRHEQDGLVDDEMVRRMQLIAPHIRRALLIGKVIDLSKLQAATFDGLAAGVFLVDAEGGLVHANASGQAMLDAADPLMLGREGLVFSDPAVDRALHDAFSAASSGDEAIAASGIAVPLKGRAGTHFLAHVLPLTSGLRRETGLGTSTVAALFVRPASIDLPAAIRASAQLYGFTPAEEKVLESLLDLGSVTAVADLLGTSKSTVKRHLEHLFAKTGTKRQAELVKLIAGFESPVRGAK